MTGQRWHIIGFHTTASLWPSSLNRERPRQHSIIEKAQDAPLQGASCAFSLIPTFFLVMVKEYVNHYLPDRYIGCKRHNVFFGIFDFIQGDTVFALRFFQVHIRTEAEVFA